MTFLAGAKDIIMDMATKIMDALAFHDHLMAQYLPSQLAAATLHATIHLCTKSFQDGATE